MLKSSKYQLLWAKLSLATIVHVLSCQVVDGDSSYILSWETDSQLYSDTNVDFDTEHDTGYFADSDTNTVDKCAARDFQVEEQVVDMLIVLDRSDSMRSDGLWNPMGRALTEVISQMKERINFGLLLFPSLNCNPIFSMCAAPSNVRVKIGDPVAAEKIAIDVSSETGVGTCGGTPTAAALSTALAYLKSIDDSNQRYVLLATDGAPNCNGSLSCFSCKSTEPVCLSGRQCLNAQKTVEASRALAKSGYPVYVLGMGGSAPWATVMNSIASAGGTRSYYSVSDTGHLMETMDNIIKSLASCRFDVDWNTLPNDTSQEPSKVNFYCKQSEKEKESLDNLIGFDEGCHAGTGWKWVDDDTVAFCGSACDKLRNRECGVVTATFGCGSIPVI